MSSTSPEAAKSDRNSRHPECSCNVMYEQVRYYRSLYAIEEEEEQNDRRVRRCAAPDNRVLADRGPRADRRPLGCSGEDEGHAHAENVSGQDLPGRADRSVQWSQRGAWRLGLEGD